MGCFILVLVTVLEVVISDLSSFPEELDAPSLAPSEPAASDARSISKPRSEATS